jgi:hypothetical protein
VGPGIHDNLSPRDAIEQDGRGSLNLHFLSSDGAAMLPHGVKPAI